MGETNVVLREKVKFDEAARFGEERGWKIDKKSVKEAAVAEEVREYRWRAGKPNQVTFMMRAADRLDYYVLAGPDSAELADAVRARFPSYSEGDILSALASADSGGDWEAAFEMVDAAEFRDYLEPVYQAFEAGFRHPDSVVRLVAVRAAGVLRWRQLRPLLERVRDDDPSDRVRDMSGRPLRRRTWDRG
jgi:hypothetical protein